jgi:aryl-alcohol dehydrogenase-like predicted oxidoreductase
VQNRYNLGDQSAERVLEAWETADIAFLPWGPVQVGDDATVIEGAAEVGATTQQVALAWTLRRSQVTLPIPGTSLDRPPRTERATVGLHLTDGRMERLDRRGEERSTS